MKKDIEKIVAEIICHELDLPTKYTDAGNEVPGVFLFGQNVKLFNTEKLQICIKTLETKDYSNRTEFTELDGEFVETQYINQSRLIQVDLCSRNNDARDRFWEVAAALKSTYAQQMQDLYCFKLGMPSHVKNSTAPDGGAVVNKFSLSFWAIVHFQKSKVIDYYDKFSHQLEKGD